MKNKNESVIQKRERIDISEMESCFFEKINKIGVQPDRLKKQREREKIQITNIKNEKGFITTGPTNI